MQKMACIRNEKEWNETHIDILVRTKYYIDRKRKKRFGSGNTGQLITRETYR